MPAARTLVRAVAVTMLAAAVMQRPAAAAAATDGVVRRRAGRGQVRAGAGGQAVPARRNRAERLRLFRPDLPRLGARGRADPAYQPTAVETAAQNSRLTTTSGRRGGLFRTGHSRRPLRGRGQGGAGHPRRCAGAALADQRGTGPRSGTGVNARCRTLLVHDPTGAPDAARARRAWTRPSAHWCTRGSAARRWGCCGCTPGRGARSRPGCGRTGAAAGRPAPR